MKVIKRNSAEVNFDEFKIINALKKANNESKEMSENDITLIANEIRNKCAKLKRAVPVEEIQDYVENALMKHNNFETARLYIRFRHQKELNRKQNTTDAKILSLIEDKNEEIKQENSNKNPTIVSVQRDYMAGEVSKDLAKRYLLPKDVIEAHEKGIIHFHDMDYYAQHMHNCCLINLEDMLQNGTVLNGTLIEKPHTFVTACTIATQIMAQVASSQYGGQTITLSHLAPFVQRSRERIRERLSKELEKIYINQGVYMPEDCLNSLVEDEVKEEVRKGVQVIQYQVNTIMSTNGQTPFITVFMYLDEVPEGQTRNDLALIIEETLKQRIQGTKNEVGVYISPTFPKLIYCLDEDNIYENSKYYYLTELAAKCSAKRLVPDYISAKQMKKIKDGQVFPSMGCRSFLSAWRNPNLNNQYQSYGRFNKGVVTINLPDVALSSKKNEEKFWKIFDERLELCHKALLCRYERLKGTLSDVAPILWQNGALARLKKGETIDKLLINGYSTISLGYAGLWECVYYMTGKRLTEEEGKEYGLKIMRYMNDKCKEWNEQLNLGFSIYGTPLESTTYKFAKCLQERFGIIPGVTDKNYVTNSYHVHVTEPISAFDKLKIESEFQTESTGGCISYVEVPNMQNNIDAVLSVMKFIYENIMYAELNTKSDYCQVCGFDGEIKIVEENGKLIWECPNCHNRDQRKMNVIRRTCGYLGSQYWNQGRTQEIKDRVLHL